MQATNNRAEGASSIASAFASLSDGSADLPPRFTALKRELISGKEDAVLASWNRLLKRVSLKKLQNLDASIIPELDFSEIAANNGNISEDIVKRLRECGTIVIRGLVDEAQALQWKEQIRDYVKENPQTKGFPANDIQVYELYWSKAQLEARAHANMLMAQVALNRVWSAKPEDPVDLEVPLTYCDRVRMRKVYILGICLEETKFVSSQVTAPSTWGHILMVDRSNAGKTPNIESAIPKSLVETGRIMTLLMWLIA